MSAAALGAVILALAPRASAVPPLYTPFPCGTTYSVTQGHNTGSHLDEGSWAWDIGIPVGGDVAAPADGVVRLVRMDSTSGGCSSAYANDANYVVVDFGDGTEALFLHLQAGSTSLQVGDPVKQGDVVGKVGLTGWVCGAHLHFQIQQTCNSWWCQSIPSTFVDFGDPGVGTSLPSNNCPPLDPCDTLAGGESFVDERTICFERQTSFWWTEPEGYLDSHDYTFGIDATESETIGTWWLEVEVAGRYRIDAHVPPSATTQGARYFADPGTGRVELALVDQSAASGWIPLGELEFSVGSDRYVELGDATGEAPSLSRRVAFDALRFTYVPSEGGGGAGVGGSGGAGGASDPTTGSGAGTTGVGGNGSDGGAANAEGDDGVAGCGCRLADRGGDASVLWLLGLAFAIARRRRSF
ncbi:MAG: peptidoglycan DD-metalloendopeptidase family protein [Myxococcales bacterium]|nr:peptidoglycan DD-metalloendopeptidase family protein [Myxococcales bacterium]